MSWCFLFFALEHLLTSVRVFSMLLPSAQNLCLSSLFCRIVCKLNTRTSILAATNPKGGLSPSEPLSLSVALASPLLSRFDLVLVLTDNRNANWDRVISSFLLEERGRGRLFLVLEAEQLLLVLLVLLF